MRHLGARWMAHDSARWVTHSSARWMRNLGGWRRIAVVLALFLGLGLAGVALPTTASAIPGFPSAPADPVIPGLSNCKEAPTPEVPGRGVEAFFQPAPANLPKAADPFAADAVTSIHEQYGYAGLRWHTYDLGCAGGAGSPEASVGSTVANWLFTVPKAAVAATGALLGAAYEPSFLTVFDPLVQTVVDALRKSVFDQWAALVFAGLGFLIVWRARQSSLRTTAAALGWALLVMMLATVLFRWPVAAGQAADSTVISTMSAVTSSLNQSDTAGRSSTGRLAASNLHDALLYQIWLGGQFGDANSVAARKYGAQLFDAQALTWGEATTLSQDSAAGQRIVEAKKAKFKNVAAAIQAEDPDAYEYLTGRRSDSRIGFAALALLAVACAVPFLIVASLLVIGALVITRFAVMLFPAIATLGLFPAMRGLVIGVGNTVAAAVINALVFGIGSAVMVKAYGVVMTPGNGLPAWLVVALVLLLTIVMWFALKPFQRLTGMVSPGRNHFADAAGALGSVTRGLGKVSGRLVTTAAGVFVGEQAARSRDDKDDKDAAGRHGHRGRRAEADQSADAGGRSELTGSGSGAGSGSGSGSGGSGSGRGSGRGIGSGLAGLPGFGGRARPEAGSGGATGATGGATAGGSGRAASGRGSSGGSSTVGTGWAAHAGNGHAGKGRGTSRTRGEQLIAAEGAIPSPASRPIPAPGRRTRPGPRRSEGLNLDDLGAGGTGTRSGKGDGDDPYSIYQPGERAGGGKRA
ncbi:MAG: hypothetical protein QG622_163 [Actinomycetota bacterium]|nr:hypothetical protein [Actinomycetota bacterium]